MRSLPEDKKTVISPVSSHYRSFPDVVLTRTGKLICVYREADTHVASVTRLLLRTSNDFGLTWSEPRELAGASISQNGYSYNFSDDGAETWTFLEEMPFKGHRPVAGIIRSGKLFITYRDVELTGEPAPRLLHPGAHAWLGDLEERDKGSVLVLDPDDSARPFGDCGYTGWVQREDGTIFVVNYHKGGGEQPYVKGYWITEGDFTGPS